jgi:UrcA family protein
MAFALMDPPVYAGAEVPPTITVDYSDLNLASSAAVKVLYRRLRTAATTVCGPFDGRGLARKAVWESCYEQALSAAVLEVSEPELTALHFNRRDLLMIVEKKTTLPIHR